MLLRSVNARRTNVLADNCFLLPNQERKRQVLRIPSRFVQLVQPSLYPQLAALTRASKNALAEETSRARLLWASRQLHIALLLRACLAYVNSFELLLARPRFPKQGLVIRPRPLPEKHSACGR